jgi:serine/threonine protein kinase
MKKIEDVCFYISVILHMDIQKQLNSGGFYDIWRRGSVVTKTPYIWYDEEHGDITRLLTNEARVLQHVASADAVTSHVARFISFEDGILTTAFIDGQPLNLFLKNGTYTIHTLMIILLQIAETLVYLQHMMPNFQHNDLHCGNVLIDEKLHITLIDFEVAEQVDDNTSYDLEYLCDHMANFIDDPRISEWIRGFCDTCSSLPVAIAALKAFST